METAVFDLKTQYTPALEKAAELICAGKLVAFPTETVYGLGADAFCVPAVKSIFEAKGRPSDNPLIVHISNMSQVELLARKITPNAQKMMQAFWPGPFTVILKKRPEVPSAVTGGLDTVAVRMPSSAFIRDLIDKSGRLIAAPSANLSGLPSPTAFEHVFADLNGRIPMIADGGPCSVGVESTVCDALGEVPVILRPGGITKEMIERVCGAVRVHEAVLGELKEREHPASPGMKYKHYAPKADVLVVCGEKNRVAQTINLRYDKNNGKAVILCMDAFAPLYGKREKILLGRGEEDVARNLFAALRTCDARGIEKVFFHGVDIKGEGLAVMNRIIRAAGHQICIVSQGGKID